METLFISDSTQMEIINNIEEVHRPIFQWMKYHYQSPREACYLLKSDYDRPKGIFAITALATRKSGLPRRIVCVDEFAPIAQRLLLENLQSKLLFVNPRARSADGGYTVESLGCIWKKACQKVGINPIALYVGMVYSNYCQFLSEKNGSNNKLDRLTGRKSSTTKKRLIPI